MKQFIIFLHRYKYLDVRTLHSMRKNYNISTSSCVYLSFNDMMCCFYNNSYSRIIK